VARGTQVSLRAGNERDERLLESPPRAGFDETRFDQHGPYFATMSMNAQRARMPRDISMPVRLTSANTKAPLCIHGFIEKEGEGGEPNER